MPAKKKSDSEAPKAARSGAAKTTAKATTAKKTTSTAKAAATRSAKAAAAKDTATSKTATKAAAAKTPAKGASAKPAAAKTAKAPAKATKTAKAATTKGVPAKASAAKKPAAKAPAKIAAAPKAPAEKAVKKPAAAKAPAAKAPTKKAPAAAKAPAKKAVAAKAPAKKAPARKPVAKAKAVAPEPVVIRPEKEIEASVPTDVKLHFFHEQRRFHEESDQRELPHEYGDTKIVVMVRDPEWVFAYWEVNDETRAGFKLNRHGHDRRVIVRFYKITGRDWPAEPAHYTFDVDVGPYSSSWYVRMPEADSEWVAELATFDDEGNYVAIVRSNPIRMPRDSVSEETDAQWMIVEETFRQLYEAAGAFTLREMRGSEEIIRVLQKQLGVALSGQGPSSGVVSSGAQVLPKAPEKGFWLQVHTELILYGATEPDANVTVMGRPVRLNPDGTFSLRFALPDGEQVLKVRAVNADGDMEREITPVVRKTTR